MMVNFADRNKVVFLGFLFFFLNGVCDGYFMENYCGEEFSFILKDEDQIELELSDNGIFDTLENSFSPKRLGYCETTFEAWISRFPKFMFYFKDFELDCDEGHLEFNIGERSTHRVSGLEGNICGVSKPKGVFTVDSRYFRIKYVPKKSQYINNIFSIIITTYDDEDSCPSYAHLCANSRCINEKLACNGYNSCGDDSGCNLTVAAIVGIVIGSVAGLALIISAIICCYCCTRRSRQTPGTIQSTAIPAVSYTTQQQHMYNLPMIGMNQGPSPYNTSLPQYQAAAYNATTDQNQQGNIRSIYGFTEGSNNTPNQQLYPKTEPISQ